MLSFGGLTRYFGSLAVLVVLLVGLIFENNVLNMRRDRCAQVRLERTWFIFMLVGCRLIQLQTWDIRLSSL